MRLDHFLSLFSFLSLSLSLLGAQAHTLHGSFPKNFATLKKGISKKDLREIKVGYSLFSKPWVQAPSSTIRRDGIGPYFNAISCMSCHDGMGRGAPPGVRHPREPSLVFKANSKKISERFGTHLSSRAIPDLKVEALVSLTTAKLGPHGLQKPDYQMNGVSVAVSPRIAPQLAGLGLIEKIKEKDIIANLHHSKGRLSLINRRVARFGWKASQVDLTHQVAAAFSADMGITSALFPRENCQEFDLDCLESHSGNDEEGVEIRQDHLGFVVKLMRSIQAPKPLKTIEKGLETFKKVDCQSCHRISYQVDGETIRPYTDLLLHDMGDALADSGTGELSRHWRTPPLWGIGSQKKVNGHNRLMHDGRAHGVREAILWHSGEARQSLKKFLELSKREQESLIKFIKTR